MDTHRSATAADIELEDLEGAGQSESRVTEASTPPPPYTSQTITPVD